MWLKHILAKCPSWELSRWILMFSSWLPPELHSSKSRQDELYTSPNSSEIGSDWQDKLAHMVALPLTSLRAGPSLWKTFQMSHSCRGRVVANGCLIRREGARREHLDYIYKGLMSQHPHFTATPNHCIASRHVPSTCGLSLNCAGLKMGISKVMGMLTGQILIMTLIYGVLARIPLWHSPIKE